MRNKTIALDAYDKTLTCPYDCGEGLLHHGRTRIYNRDREDGPATLYEIDGARVTQTRAEGTPGRRDAIEIEMDCEHCGPVGVLRIMQHKGSTYLTFEEDWSDERRNERVNAFEAGEQQVAL